MKSIKRGRGPSMMEGVASVAVGIFGVIWTIMAASMGGGLFALFGVVFVGVAVVQGAYAFRNATGKQRFSEYEITSDGEEPDPLNARFGHEGKADEAGEDCEPADGAFCPYCGAKAEQGYVFCSRCGKKLP